MTFNEAKGLVTLLSSNDEEFLIKVLTVISNCSVYPANQDHLADAGCPLVLRDLIISPEPTVQVSVVQAIASLANSPKNQATLQVCIPVLLRNATDPEASPYLRALSLTALTNLSLGKVTVAPYIGKLHFLFKLLEEGNTIKIQALKLLNNLSLSPDMVPYLLATKVNVLQGLRVENLGDFPV
ncbi:armadillo repeat-containing X-linked protein 2-like isoform X2 [Tachypleus tridentatus]|uniref:armadillo repeat-containing X-linked protein 2-like isoform X2 n=1 Tax=Tachypleus tridentatus TaxID=6853 RepID=UPI003FD17800